MTLIIFFSKYLPNSWKTLAMRLAIRQSILLSVLTMVAMLVLYWLVSNFVLVQISSDLKYSLQQLNRVESQQGEKGLIQRLDRLAIENESRGHSHRYYLYLSKDNNVLAGSLRHWPDEAKTNGKVSNIYSKKMICRKSGQMLMKAYGRLLLPSFLMVQSS